MTLVEGWVLDASGHGLFLYPDMALVYAGAQRFDVVSASLGGYIPKRGYPVPSSKLRVDVCGAAARRPSGWR